MGDRMETAGNDTTSAVANKKSSIDADFIRKQIADARAVSDQGKHNEAIEALMAVEKQCRLAEDMVLSQEACVAVLDVAQAGQDWNEFLNYITTLTKRRGQLKSTVQVVVRKASAVLDTSITRDQRVQLIRQLQAVTEGKIFLELDRARLTKRLARIYEAEGKIAEAADALQEIAVETFGAMHRSEKIAYVLDQMRLCMANSDYTRAQILSRKVSPKAFAAGVKDLEAGDISLQGTAVEVPAADTPSMPELKVLYYRQMIQYYSHFDNYLEIVRCLLVLYGDVKKDAAQWPPLLQQIVWYLVLCPRFSNAEGSASDYLTLRATVAADTHLSELPEHNDLLQVFITEEVTGVNALLTRYAAEIKAEEDIFGGVEGEKRVADLRDRITEHNVLIVAKYYAQLRLTRLSVLLGLSEEEAERHVSELVVKRAVTAKIDRVEGIVRFQPSSDGMQVLDRWSHSIATLLGLVESTCQKIQKEAMQHNVPIGTSA